MVDDSRVSMISLVASSLQSQTPSLVVQLTKRNSRCSRHVSNNLAVFMNNSIFSNGVNESKETRKRIFTKTGVSLGKQDSTGRTREE